MKTTLLMLIFILLLVPICSNAQPIGMRPWKKEPFCGRASELNLSVEQDKTLQMLQQTYLQETQLLRAQLLTKRLEIRELLTHPENKTDLIRTKFIELGEIHSRMEEKGMEYLLKVRKLLTPEQLKFWCPEEEFPMWHRRMPGHSPMRPLNPKRNPPPEE